MQCAIDGDNKPISTILIDASGDKTEKLNADCLNRRDDLALSLPDAIASLITLQTYAPQGGSGNHVSIRGGGPMTTLIVGGDDLWSTVWPNVETVEQIQSRAVGSTEFAWPWLWTRETITPDDAHPLTVYWATPRRAQLIVSDDGLVRSWRQVSGPF